LITAVLSFFIGALWVSVISNMGIASFVNTLGAVLAPIYGIMVCDYYLVRKQNLNLQDLFSSAPEGEYHYNNGWNNKALQAFAIGAIFSVATVWVPALSAMAGFGWVVGAVIGALVYKVLMSISVTAPVANQLEPEA
jgi:NCS1 family nucleobase:cation symporter-1